MKPPEALRTQIVQAPKLNGKSNGKEPRLGQVKTVWAGILSKVGVKNDGQHLSKKSNKEEPKVPSYQRIGDANFSLEKYGASKPFTLTEEEQVSYSVSTPVVVARNPANIEPGIYFETRLTPEQWDKNMRGRIAVRRAIFAVLEKSDQLPEEHYIEGHKFQTDGHIVIKVEIKPIKLQK